MIYDISDSSTDGEVQSIVYLAVEGDTIVVPDIKKMNLVTSLLIEIKPDTLVYVKIPDEIKKRKPTRVVKTKSKSIFIDIPADVENDEYVSSTREVLLHPYTIDSKTFHMAYDLETDTLYVRSI